MISISTAILIFLFASSFFLNVFLFLKLRKKPKRQPSIELREFFGDLTGGIALAAFSPDGNVARVDPGSILLRSPKSKV